MKVCFLSVFGARVNLAENLSELNSYVTARIIRQYVQLISRWKNEGKKGFYKSRFDSNRIR
jgi:hypothetical protein